jgi:hypothetical protein
MQKKPFLLSSSLFAALLASQVATAAPTHHLALDPAARVQLSRSAAEQAGLRDFGLDWRDLYGVINAETSWVPRDGMGRNGVVSRGLAQFEPATAKAVGLRDPNNPVQAVRAAARLLREAAAWSAQRVAHLALSPAQRAAKLREGISVYYNLSSRARAAWSGLNTSKLPIETLRHIHNVREGALQAEQLNARLGGPKLPPLPAAPDLHVAQSAPAHGAAPKALGTIAWSGRGRSYVVWSNGDVRPETGGELPRGAIRFTPRRRG